MRARSSSRPLSACASMAHQISNGRWRSAASASCPSNSRMIGNACPGGRRFALLASWLRTSTSRSPRASAAKAERVSAPTLWRSPRRRTAQRRTCSPAWPSATRSCGSSSSPRRFNTQNASSEVASFFASIARSVTASGSGRVARSRRACSRCSRLGCARSATSSFVAIARRFSGRDRTKFFGTTRRMRPFVLSHVSAGLRWLNRTSDQSAT